MNDFSENELINDNSEQINKAVEISDNHEPSSEEEISSIFSDPQEHHSKKTVAPKKRRIRSIIAATVAVAILGTGTFLAVKFVPQITDDTDNSEVEYIDVINYKADDISKVVIKNINGTHTLLSKTVASDSQGEEETVWYIDGIDDTLVDTDSVKELAAACATVQAFLEVDTKTPAECGLEDSKNTVEVTLVDNTTYSFAFGSISPDQLGTYFKTSLSDSIYIVESSVVDSFNFDPLDLAANTAIPAATFTGDISAYLDEDNTLASFDSITITGSRFPQPMKIVPNSDTDLSEYLGFLIKSPVERYAANVDKLLSLFGAEVGVTGLYSYDISSAALKEVGLDDPDIIITISLASQKRTFKISVVDEYYCAVITDGITTIKKVPTSNLNLANYYPEDFYSTLVFMDGIYDITNFTLTTPEQEFDFGIAVNSDPDDDENYTITHHGQRMTASYFQEFYKYFVTMTNITFDTVNTTDLPSATVKITDKNGNNTIITYTKVSATRYQYAVNGENLGQLTAATYNKMIKYIKLVSENKAIN